MNSRLLFTIFWLSCISTAAYAQKSGQELIDSLMPELQRAKPDTNRVKILNDLSYEYGDIDPDNGTRYGKQALELATKLKWEKGKAMANRYIGINYENKSDFPNAIPHYEAAMKIYRATGRKKGLAHTALDIAAMYVKIDNYPKGLEHALTSLRLYEELKDSSGVAGSCRTIADIYYYYNDYQKALGYFQRALNLYEISGDLRGVLHITGSIGSLYRMQDNYATALGYFFRAMKMNEEYGSREYSSMLANCIGDIYTEQHKYTDALTYLFKALTIAKERNNEALEASAVMDIGRCYVSMAENAGKQDYAWGLSATGSAAEIHGEQLPDGIVPKGKTRILQQAVSYLNRAIAIDKKMGNLVSLSPAYWNLAKADSLLGNYKDALYAYNQHMFYKDSIFSKEKSIQIARVEMRNKMHVDSVSNAQITQIAETKYRNQRNYTIMGIAGIVLLAGVSVFILRERGKSEKERKRSDGLLLNILPGEVAEELKTNGTTTARHYDNVTVLFTDFVNFTQASENMGAQALIDELHTCFKAFDEITGKYDIEKIKTIGDAYLAICGLPRPDTQHAVKVVKAATEINAFMADRFAKLGNRTFEVRIGIHSGSVVAGIVGVKKFAYDIWGDTVNTAARMEQHSEAAKINISQTTYELVKDKFNCEYRGEVEAKGKGVMKMYFVI